MKLEGKAAEEKGMVLIDKYMNQCFGDDVWLSACHGPVSMCVFEMEYDYAPLNYKFKFECERGGLTIMVLNSEGLMFSPWIVYPQARYALFCDNEHDVKESIQLINMAIRHHKVKFFTQDEFGELSATTAWRMPDGTVFTPRRKKNTDDKSDE